MILATHVSPMNLPVLPDQHLGYEKHVASMARCGAIDALYARCLKYGLSCFNRFHGA